MSYTPNSLCGHFQHRVAELGGEAAIRRADGSAELTWSEYGRRVRTAAAGLTAAGVSRGDVVGIMLTNRPEFHIVDAAAMHLGAVTFSVYNTNAAPQIAYLFHNAEPSVVITETQFLERIVEAGDGSADVVVVDAPNGTAGVTTLAELIAAPAPADFDFDAAIAQRKMWPVRRFDPDGHHRGLRPLGQHLLGQTAQRQLPNIVARARQHFGKASLLHINIRRRDDVIQFPHR